MNKVTIAGGTAHTTPKDLEAALISNGPAAVAWQSLTELARNEWICWTISVKQPATRAKHVERTVAQLLDGKRRPCCWMGCTHRTDKPFSPSAQWILDRQSQNK
jgi:uncharacterized protein YdeI (YjbR/CyaY-like superfamily)